MKVGVVKETFPGEKRVSLVPSVLPKLDKAGLNVVVEKGAGYDAGFPDEAYASKGARLVDSRAEVFGECDVVTQVRALGANPEAGAADIGLLKRGQILIAMTEPLTPNDLVRQAAASGITVFALELVPRITRAQSMDVLSSMATIAGYKAVILAMNSLGRMFPMMMTAAGTITPAKVLVLGAGVAGLQAIATARRNGAVVHANDIRPAVKEQVESLGAKFVDLPIETKDTEDKGGYAKELSAETLRKQQEVLAEAAAASDVLITTAAVPGRKAPLLAPRSMVEGMAPGSVIVDLAAERGGNCELTRPGETVTHQGVQILGPVNLPSTVPYHASEMYARNVTNFLLNMMKEGKLEMNLEDEIVKETLVCRDGEVLNERVRQILGLTAAPGQGGAS